MPRSVFGRMRRPTFRGILLALGLYCGSTVYDADKKTAFAEPSPNFAAEARLLAGIAADERVTVDFVGRLDGSDVAALYVDVGGASCVSGTEVLVAVRPGVQPVIGRIVDDSCSSRPEIALGKTESFWGEETALSIQTFVGPALDGSLWRFTPREGLKLVGHLTFEPQPGTVLSDNALSKMNYTFDLYSNEEFMTRFRQLTGRDYAEIIRSTQVSDPIRPTEDQNYLVARG